MPYLGHPPSTGEDNNFKILDDISSYTLTFDGSDSGVVSTSDETIYSYNHRFVQGQRVTYNNGGGGNIAGLTSGTVYYIIKQDHNNIQLATSASNAAAGTAINITAVGTGASHTLNVAFDGTNTKFKATHTTGQKARITRGAQLVLSVNGVIQQPHDSSTPSTGFGFDVDGTIIFSEAPESSDAFWGHILTNNNVTFDISDNKIDHFTGDGSTLAFTLSKSPPNNENILVTIDGVVQYPNDSAGNIRAYSVAANVINFTSAPGSGTAIEVRHIGFAGATSGGGGGVTGFYGRTGNAVLKSTDHITTGNIVAGVVTATSAVITGDLTVNGTTTTLDTDLIGVDKIEVAANNTTVAVAVTQSGAGDLVRLFDSTTEKLRITDDGLVGIGTNNPTGKLHVAHTNTTVWPFASAQSGTYAYTPYPHELVIDNDVRGTGGSFAGIYFNAGADTDGSKVSTARIAAIDTGSYKADLVFSNRGSGGSDHKENLRIASNGRVGINSTVPTAPLNVQAENSTGTCVRLNQEGTNKKASIYFQDATTTGNDSWITNENYDLTVYAGYGGKLNLGAYQTTGITVLSTGKVGVGTEDPSNALDVQAGTTNTAIVARSTDAKAQISLLDNATTSVGCVVIGAEGDDLFLTSGSGGAERLRITSTGLVGINTSPSGAQLVIKNSDDANLNAITILNDNGNMSSSLSQDSTGAGSYLQKDNAGNIKTFIRSYNTSYFLGGNVGIGDDTPENKLKINVSGSNDGVVVQNTSTDKIAMYGARNGDATIQIGQWGSTASGTSLGVANANLAFMYTTSYASTHPSALLIGNNAGIPLIFATNATERLRIASDGKVHFGSQASVGANGYILKETSGDYKFNIFASSSTTTNRIITINSRSNVEALRIDASRNIGQAVTPSAWSSAQANDFFAYQVGSGTAIFGRGSGDQDRGGISANLYCTASAWKYIAAGHAGRIYFEDGSIVFNNIGSTAGTADATATLLERLRITKDGQVKILGGGNVSAASKGNLFVADGGTAAQTAGEGGTITFGAWLGGDLSAPYSMAAIQGISNSATTNINTGSLIFSTRDQSGGPSERMRINDAGDLFARSDATVYLVLGNSGDATSGGANNNMNWIRGNSTNLQYNCNGGYHAWENVGSEKMKLNGHNLELMGASQCRIVLGSAGTGANDSNWIRGDGNYMMLNSATSDGHIFECAGTAKAKINPTLGVRAENTCKAWVSYRSEAGSEGIIDDFYVASVVDEATGTFFVNLDGDIGTEDGVAYIFGSHNDGSRAVQAVIGYTPSHGSMNPWWTMEDDGTRVNLMRGDTNAKIDGEWFSMAAFADAI